MRQVGLALCWLVACGPGERAPGPRPALVPRSPHPAPSLHPGLAAPPLSEAAARGILAERFRAAGLHIRQDLGVTVGDEGLVVDGLDGDRQIGFEYVGPDDAPMSTALRQRVAGGRPRILVVDACDEAALVAAADHFLAALQPL